MAYEHIRLSRDGGVVTLAFNRPDTRNSMTPAMGEEVVEAVAEVRADPTARVVVLTGSGAAFSSGGDLGMLARDAGVTRGGDAPTMAGSPRDFYARYLAVRTLSLQALKADHEYLLKGDFFTVDVIERWIQYKMENEVTPMRLRPVPYEFALYFDI